MFKKQLSASSRLNDSQSTDNPQPFKTSNSEPEYQFAKAEEMINKVPDPIPAPIFKITKH